MAAHKTTMKEKRGIQGCVVRGPLLLHIRTICLRLDILLLGPQTSNDVMIVFAWKDFFPVIYFLNIMNFHRYFCLGSFLN